jgi:hypothetical protein
MDSMDSRIDAEVATMPIIDERTKPAQPLRILGLHWGFHFPFSRCEKRSSTSQMRQLKKERRQPELIQLNNRTKFSYPAVVPENLGGITYVRC